jgi:DNA helicase-2/ATP-dependent DNA helicase PcrA
MDKLKIIIAGPGAGKTYNLKNEAINCLPNLDRNRFCAVITYTNAATEELMQRISTDIPIPQNVFIGTIHSFLIRFIIEPFGKLTGLVPIEKHYVDSVLLNYTPINIYAEKNAKQSRAVVLAKQGILAYDIVIDYAKDILERFPNISIHLGNRLQYIYIDEYQDSRIYIHQIFQKVISLNSTKVTVIGDPLQAVFKFTYLNSLIKNESKSQPKSFSETPMVLYSLKFRNGVDEVLKENHRSSVNIVNLINKYIINSEQEQKSITGDNGIPVYFINNTIASGIHNTYKQLKIKHDIDSIHNTNLKKSHKPFLKDFFLTRDWIKKDNKRKPKLSSVYDILNGEAVRLEKGNHRISSILQEISRCILAVAGVKKKEFINSNHDEIEYRKFCFEIARYLKSKNFNDPKHRINSIRKQFRDEFNIIDDSGKQVNVEKSLIEFSNNEPISITHYPESCYSSIHSAKGLEATSVLAIAYSKKELDKWLNFQEANKSLEDDYRLGYVAFSRARDMLCIACLEEVSDETKNKLESLNIVFYPNN